MCGCWIEVAENEGQLLDRVMVVVWHSLMEEDESMVADTTLEEGNVEDIVEMSRYRELKAVCNGPIVSMILKGLKNRLKSFWCWHREIDVSWNGWNFKKIQSSSWKVMSVHLELVWLCIRFWTLWRFSLRVCRSWVRSVRNSSIAPTDEVPLR